MKCFKIFSLDIFSLSILFTLSVVSNPKSVHVAPCHGMNSGYPKYPIPDQFIKYPFTATYGKVELDYSTPPTSLSFRFFSEPCSITQ